MIHHLPAGRILGWGSLFFILVAADVEAAGKGGRGEPKPEAKPPESAAFTEWQVQDSSLRYKLHLI